MPMNLKSFDVVVYRIIHTCAFVAFFRLHPHCCNSKTSRPRAAQPGPFLPPDLVSSTTTAPRFPATTTYFLAKTTTNHADLRPVLRQCYHQPRVGRHHAGQHAPAQPLVAVDRVASPPAAHAERAPRKRRRAAAARARHPRRRPVVAGTRPAAHHAVVGVWLPGVDHRVDSARRGRVSVCVVGRHHSAVVHHDDGRYPVLCLPLRKGTQSASAGPRRGVGFLQFVVVVNVRFCRHGRRGR